MYKILIADDEELIRALIAKYAKFEGYETEEARDGMEAVRKCAEENFDIVIMDIMMPELDGFSAVREIRKKSDVPVIMLSARGEEYDKINGFECGADDYVVKPFSPKELMLRIEAVLKRTCCANSSATGGNTPHDVFEIGPLRCDITGRIVYVDGKRIDLHSRLYKRAAGRKAHRHVAEGIRSSFLHDKEPEHRAQPRKADHRGVGVRLLRRRQDS